MLPPGFTLEERARLSEDAAIRRYFDRRNLALLRWASWFFAALAFSFLNHGLMRASPMTTAVAGAALVMSLLGAFALRRIFRPGAAMRWLDRLGGKIGREARAFTIGYLVLQFAAYSIFSWGVDGRIALSVMFGMLLLAIRLQASETILLYGGIGALAMIEGLMTGRSFGGGEEPVIAELLPLAIFSLVALGLSRRSRKRFLAEWRPAREEAIERIRIREELDFAREIQLSMLPKEAPPIPWLEIASVTHPATEVGGDYYDYYPLPDGRFACVIGDVAGHGLASGMVLSGIRSCLTILNDDLGMPMDVMARLDTMLRRTSSHRIFVTLSILVLDPEQGSAVLTSAGHPPLFLFRRASGRVERVETASLPLGTRLPSRFDQRSFDVAPGDVLMLQTDGLYETADAEGSVYGFERLERSFAASAAKGSLAGIREQILGDLWTFRGEAPQLDDVTLVLLRMRP